MISLKPIEALRDALRSLEDAADRARETKLLDDASMEDVSHAHSDIDRILMRLRVRGLMILQKLRS